MKFVKLLINFYFCPDVLYDQPLGSSVIYYRKKFSRKYFFFLNTDYYHTKEKILT
jgi:hypothetical protein